MKELDNWMKAFGIITDSARKNVLVTFISIVFLFLIISVGMTIQVVITSNRDKEKLYDRLIEEVRREQLPILQKMEDDNEHTNRNVEQTILKADTILEKLKTVAENKTE